LPNGSFDFSSYLPPPPVMLRCPVPGCRLAFDRLPSVTAHLRRDHAGVVLSQEAADSLDIGRCPHCTGYYRPGALRAKGHVCRPRHPPPPPPLLSQLANNPPPKPLPTPPPHLTWSAGAPSEDPAWLLTPLTQSLGEPVSWSGGLAQFYAAGFWQRWREHLTTELASRGPDLAAPSKPADFLPLLQGADAKIQCPSCPHTSQLLLKAADHLNTAHWSDPTHAHEDIKRCLCGFYYVNTAMGKHQHHDFCSLLSHALSSKRLVVPPSHSSVHVLDLGTPTISIDSENNVSLSHLGALALPGLNLHSLNFGAKALGHGMACYYLCSSAPGVPPSDAESPANDRTGRTDHEAAAASLKSRLAPIANSMHSFGASVDFTAANTPADTEVVIADAKDASPIAICDLNCKPPTFLCFLDSASHLPDDTPVKVLCRLNEHYLRLYPAVQAPVTLGRLKSIAAYRVKGGPVAATPSKCPTEEILAWAASFQRRWQREQTPPPPRKLGSAPLGSSRPL